MVGILVFAVVRGCEPTYINLAFENGPRDVRLLDKPLCYVNRDNLTKGISLNRNYSGVYSFVHGPHGCGTSTALRSAVVLTPRSLYVEVDTHGTFPDEFAMALSIDFAFSSTNSIYTYLGTLSSPYRRIRPTGKREHLLIILDVLKSVLVGMDKPPTLVLDNVSALFSAYYEPVGGELVRMLQHFAKSMADRRMLTVVFAGSEGRLLNFFYQVSAASRLVVDAIKPDISAKEAVTYLRCIDPLISLDEASHWVTLVGGRFVLLNLVAGLKENKAHTMADIESSLFDLVRYELQTLQISIPPSSRSTTLANRTWDVVSTLLTSPKRELSYGDFLTLLEPCEDTDSLIEGNIFFISFGKPVKFQSSLVEAFFKSEAEGAFKNKSAFKPL